MILIRDWFLYLNHENRKENISPEANKNIFFAVFPVFAVSFVRELVQFFRIGFHYRSLCHPTIMVAIRADNLPFRMLNHIAMRDTTC